MKAALYDLIPSLKQMIYKIILVRAIGERKYQAACNLQLTFVKLRASFPIFAH